jgi:hypothetical protein
MLLVHNIVTASAASSKKTATAASSVVAFIYLYQSCQIITSAHKESMYFYEKGSGVEVGT